jgi:hypothetical protein
LPAGTALEPAPGTCVCLWPPALRSNITQGQALPAVCFTLPGHDLFVLITTCGTTPLHNIFISEYHRFRAVGCFISHHSRGFGIVGRIWHRSSVYARGYPGCGHFASQFQPLVTTDKPLGPCCSPGTAAHRLLRPSLYWQVHSITARCKGGFSTNVCRFQHYVYSFVPLMGNNKLVSSLHQPIPLCKH